MFPLVRRAVARTLTLFIVAGPTMSAIELARAQESVGPKLGLEEAAQLAVTGQPLLETLRAQASGAREAAVAAAQLPDPQLVAGIVDVPVNGRDAGSLTRDSDTQLQIGLVQEFSRSSKRRLRGQLESREAVRLDAEIELTRRTVRRDASLAWLELWRYTRELELARDSVAVAQTQLQLAEIALRTGTATQVDFLAARQEVNQLRDSAKGAEQSVAHAQNRLSRWIGDAAFRPVGAELPQWPALPALETVASRLDGHPLLGAAKAQIAAAQAGAELAQAAYRPDWRVELGYADRPEYSDLVTVKVGIDLPFFTHDRQDRGVAAALAREASAESAASDVRRQLDSEARLNHHDFARITERLRSYDDTLLPQGNARIEAALAGWRSGRGRFREVLDAHRAALETQEARLELQRDLAGHFVQLTYLGAFDEAHSTEMTDE